LQPVEYYNNLPYHSEQPDPSVEHIAIIIDPIIATGGTAIAAIQTLREWGVTKIIMLSILGALEGVRKAAQEWDKVEIWLGQVDDTLDSNGMIKPGCGDVGDRLFGTKGR
jgi:uracil phosphoribosyltransferase